MDARPELDLWQFRLSAEARDLAASDAVRVGPFALRCGEGLDPVPVEDAGGHAQGYLLGFPIDLDRQRMVVGRYVVPVRRDACRDADEFCDAVIASLGGPFLWVHADGQVVRIYPDAGAQVPCVWDAEGQIVGSTAHALFLDDEYDARFQVDRFHRLGVDGSGWFPAGLTAHDKLERLLPNHYLDLTDWTARRCWPRAGWPRARDPHEAIANIIDLVRRQTTALLASGKDVVQALTAGQETRLLLGISKPQRDRLSYVTIVGNDRHLVDSLVTRRLARRFGLRHEELHRVAASPAERELFIRRGGHSVVDSMATYYPSVAGLKDKYFVGGVGGEIPRAFFWRSTDEPGTTLGAETLLGRFGLPRDDLTLERLAAWLGELPTRNALHALDLAYIEHRIGPWSSAQFYSDPSHVRFAPLLTRRGAELMLGLPSTWKVEQRMWREVVRQVWPELGEIPINSAGQGRDILAGVQRVIDDPRIVARFIRKRLS